MVEIKSDDFWTKHSRWLEGLEKGAPVSTESRTGDNPTLPETTGTTETTPEIPETPAVPKLTPEEMKAELEEVAAGIEMLESTETIQTTGTTEGSKPKRKYTRRSTAPESTVSSDLAAKLLEVTIHYAIEQNPDCVTDIIQKVEDYITSTYDLPKKVIEVRQPSKPTTTLTELTHKKFPDILTMVTSNIPVFLVGNAGTGKNHLCQQVSKALNIPFYFSNAITNEYKIGGFIDANGHYHETQFFEAFTKGGLFFFDEVDASIPEVLVLLNAAIENKYFNFPTGKFDAHPDFRIIAAGNTFGQGADIQYVGRYQLDAASLDRFAVIEIDYDEDIEMHIANDDSELVNAIRTYREAVYKSGIRTIVSYRALKQLSELFHNTDMEKSSAVQYVLMKGLSKDDRNILLKELSGQTNKYLKTIKEVLSK